MVIAIIVVLITFLLSLFIRNEKASNTFFDFLLITSAVTVALFIMDISFAVGMNDKSKEIINNHIKENKNHLLDYGLYTKDKNKIFDYLFYDEEFIYISVDSKEIKENQLILEELKYFNTLIEKEKLLSSHLLIYFEDDKSFYKMKDILFKEDEIILGEIITNSKTTNYLVKSNQ